MHKKQLFEQYICTHLIIPALQQAGWDIASQVREEFLLTKGGIIVRGRLHARITSGLIMCYSINSIFRLP
jgi:type I restriction enzyme R subunit